MTTPTISEIRPSWAPPLPAKVLKIELAGTVEYAIATLHKPDGAAASLYGVRCELIAMDASGSAIVRASGKAIVVAATAAGEKPTDPEATVALAQSLREQAREQAAIELLRELGTVRANAALGIG